MSDPRAIPCEDAHLADVVIRTVCCPRDEQGQRLLAEINRWCAGATACPDQKHEALQMTEIRETIRVFYRSTRSLPAPLVEWWLADLPTFQAAMAGACRSPLVSSQLHELSRHDLPSEWPIVEPELRQIAASIVDTGVPTVGDFTEGAVALALRYYFLLDRGPHDRERPRTARPLAVRVTCKRCGTQVTVTAESPITYGRCSSCGWSFDVVIQAGNVRVVDPFRESNPGKPSGAETPPCGAGEIGRAAAYFGLQPVWTVDRDQLQRRYRDMLQQYHPDKVTHLGEELRHVAHQKTLEIQEQFVNLERLIRDAVRNE